MVDRAPRGDKVVVMGDLNARVGNNVARWKGVIGKQGENVENDSGRRLLITERYLTPSISTRRYTNTRGSVQGEA